MKSSSLKRAGVIGLGIIGSRVADNLRARGFGVSVWSRRKRPEAPGWVDTALDLVRNSDVIQIFVTDGEALLDVVGDMLPGLGAGRTVINCATVGLSETREAAERVAATGAGFLDAPFTGSRDAAAAGQLVYYAAGDPALLEHVRPVLEASGREILYTGETGTATVLKIATNMISASTVQVLAEALGVVASQGIPGDRFLAAMELNASCSALIRMKLPGMISGDFTPHFSLKNMFKDSRYAMELAGEAGIELPVLTAASDCMAGLVAAGRGDDDYSVLAVNFVNHPKPSAEDARRKRNDRSRPA